MEKRPGQRYAEWDIMEYDRYAGGSIMVLGSISVDGLTDLQVIDRAP